MECNKKSDVMHSIFFLVSPAIQFSFSCSYISSIFRKFEKMSGETTFCTEKKLTTLIGNIITKALNEQQKKPFLTLYVVILKFQNNKLLSSQKTSN